jgi:hypothetical protein
VSPAETTPGIWRILSSVCSKELNGARRRIVAVAGFLHLHGEQVDASKPGSTAKRRCMLRNNRPALTSSTTASETSVTTRVRRIQWRLPVAAGVWRIPVCRSWREACKVDTRPTAMPMSVVRANANRKTAAVNGDCIEPWQPGGLRSSKARAPGLGNHHAQRAAERGKQQALGQQLAGKPALRCAQRGTHGKLRAALRAARKQEIGDVDTGDEQNQQDCAKNRKQRGPHALGQIALQGMHDDAVGSAAGAVIALGIGLRQRVQNHAQLVAACWVSTPALSRPIKWR